jgi:hypothetical protein
MANLIVAFILNTPVKRQGLVEVFKRHDLTHKKFTSEVSNEKNVYHKARIKLRDRE